MTGLKRHLWGSMFALLLASAGFASNWTEPASNLAKAIVGTTGPGTITLTVTNSSSLPSSDAGAIQKELEAQLQGTGIRIGSGANASSEVHVTLSENLQGYLWVAEIKHGNEVQVQMVPAFRAEAQPAARSGPSVAIRKTLLWSQPEQILDAYAVGDRMVVLGSNAVSLLSMKDGRWQREQALDIPRLHVFPRDMRGLLVPAKDHMADVYLPGEVCNVTASSSTAIACREGDDPWPLGARSALYNPARNFFTGALFPAGSKSTGPFYSLVEMARSNLLLTTGVDGRVRVSDGGSERALAASNVADWGSDAASIKSGCGTGTQLLVTNAGDDTVADSLRAFEFPDREPVQVSAAAEFPGPIMALWTHGENSVTAVSRSLRTGSYEAYNVSVTCNQ